MSVARGYLEWRYNGSTLALTEDNGLIVETMPGVFGLPPQEVEATDLPQGGAYVRTQRSKGRHITLGIWAVSEAAKDALMALMAENTTGTLAAIRSDTGAERTITARVDGLQTRIRPHGYNIALRLLAPWPWWAGDSETYVFSEGERPLFFPILPLRVTSGGVYSGATLTVAGNGITYPTITVTGPLDYVELENTTTGASLRVDCALGSGEKRTITMGPVASIVDAAGANKMSEYTSGAFWPLLPGENVVQVVAPNTDATTQIAISWRPSYAGGW